MNLLVLLAWPASLAAAPAPTTALTAFEDGQIPQALTLARAELANPNSLGPDAAETAQLVETFSLLRLDRAVESQKSLDQLAATGLDLGPYVSYLRCQIATALWNCTAAETAAQAMEDASVFAASAWVLVATCAMHVKDLERTSIAIAKIENTAYTDGNRADAVLWRARLAEAQGESVQARDHYRTILIDYPFAAAARSSRERLGVMARQGLEVAPLAPEELLPRAETERSYQHPQNARRTYRSVVMQSKRHHRADLVTQAELGLIELDMVEQRYGRALKHLANVLAAPQDPEVRAQALFLQGDILARRGQVSAALASFQQAIGELPTQPFTHLAALTAAQVAYNTRDLPLARKFATWLLAQAPVDADFTYVRDDGARGDARSADDLRDTALWLLAWIERRSHAAPAIVDSYLAKIGADGELTEGALYWRARLAIEAADPESASVFTHILLQRAPTSFYALLALSLMDRTSAGAGLQMAVPASLAGAGLDAGLSDSLRPTAQPNDVKGALVLFEHGMHSEARRVLRLVNIHNLSDADRVIAAYLYRGCGELHRAALITRQSVRKPKDSLLDRAVVNLAYPRPYDQIVATAAADYDVPVELVYAIMREESSFNPLAVSPRRARGLMQMIKPTAYRLAREADLHRFHTRQLFNPEISIRLGTLYLASLIHEMDGNLAAAVAAYQAGEKTVGRWVKSRGNLDTDEFIEDIPFTSTRQYVKKVLASYGVYRLLDGAPPDDAANLLQSIASVPDAAGALR